MRKPQCGIALVLVLMILALLSLLAAGLLTAMTTETRITDNYRTEAQLLYLAEAGIEEGREIIRQGLVMASPTPFIDNRIFVDTSGRAAGTYSVTLVRDSPLTLRSVGRLASASKTIDVRLRKTGFPWVPDAITLDEDIPLADGVDSRLATPEGLEQIVRGILRNATDVFRPPWGEATYLGAIGSPADYRIVVIEGDCEFANASGYGTLLVRGDLTVSGFFSWNGLVLVIGQGMMRSSDGAAGQISGAIFLARTRQTDRDGGNPLGTLLDRRGPVSFNLSPEFITVQRSDSDIDLANKRFPFVVTTYREY
jgi:hypothetical protein